MKLRPEEITAILKERIEQFDVETDLAEVGTVLQVGDGIARVHGLENCVSLEMLEFEHGVTGIAFNLEEDNVGVALFGDVGARQGGRARAPHRPRRERPGRRRAARPRRRPARQPARRPGRRSRRPSAGRSSSRRRASSQRQPVKEPLQTGIKAIDSMIPIGRGQRELIIGDRATGKTAIAVDTILNQRGQDVICIYVAIGQKASTVAQVYERLQATRARWTTRSSSPRRPQEAAPIKWMAPFAGAAMGEYFLYNGGHALVHLRRPLEARRRVPPDVAAAAPPAGPRGVPGRRLLPPLPPARARLQALGRARRRLADGAADHRDAGRRRRPPTSRRT